MSVWTWSPPLLEGRLISRYERFIAEVELSSGEQVRAHCVNPGRMEGLVVPGAKVWLSEQPGASRALRFTWELIELDGVLIGANTGLPNRLIENLLRQKLIRGVRDATRIAREHRVGKGHIVDFALTRRGALHLVEVKNAHLVYPDGVAYFPDSTSERAVKHVKALEGVVRGGGRASVFFTVLRADAQAVAPSAFHAPEFAESLERAAKQGLEVRAFRLRPSLAGYSLDAELPVVFEQPSSRDVQQWSSALEATTGWRRKDGRWSGAAAPAASARRVGFAQIRQKT